MSELSFVVLGPSTTSTWGNGHATTYRGLVRELCRRGHRVTFLERDLPSQADTLLTDSHEVVPRDTSSRGLTDSDPPGGRTELYRSVEELKSRFLSEIKGADVVIVGSCIPDGIACGEWVLENARGVRAFYDLDTPVTLRAVAAGSCTYLAARQIPEYQLYLSFTGGPTLRKIESRFRSPRACPLYCAVDPEIYYPQPLVSEWDLGYLGTYAPDRQSKLERLLLDPARTWPRGRFIVAGPQYPDGLAWPTNVARSSHIGPHAHRAFYNAQRFTLNITRSDMLAAGWSPSVRLFEAAACGTPIISDLWEGIDEFFEPGRELVIARDAGDVMYWLRGSSPEACEDLARRARKRVLRSHTAARRAETLETYVTDVLGELARGRAKGRNAKPAR
jgi:spore maturation protein CgeB